MITMEDLVEINALIARARRHLRDFDTSTSPDDYFQYEALWRELKEQYGFELPPYKGYRPTSPVVPLK